MTLPLRRKPRTGPDGLARALLIEFVENPEMDSLDELPPDKQVRRRYQACARLYRLALVLMVLLGEERKNRRFSSVRERLEALVFS